MLMRMKKVGLNNKLGKAFRGSSRGFTLIEVLIALALFAIIAITFAGGLSTTSRSVITADVRTNAESLARTQMEYVKNQPYSPAPTEGVGNYTKITGVPPSYSIWSVSRNGTPVNGGLGDLILGIPWNSTTNNATNTDNGLQKITLVIKHEGRDVITLEDYKVNR